MLKLRSILKQSSVGRALSEIFVGGAAQGSTDRGGEETRDVRPRPHLSLQPQREPSPGLELRLLGESASQTIILNEKEKPYAWAWTFVYVRASNEPNPLHSFPPPETGGAIRLSRKARPPSKPASTTPHTRQLYTNPSRPLQTMSCKIFFFSPHSPFCPWGWEHSNGVAQGT